MAGLGGIEQSQQRAESAVGAAPCAAAPFAASAAPLLAEEVRDAEGAAAAEALERMGDPSAAEVRLASEPASAATARRMALSVVRRWGLPHLAEVVELLVSELVGNAVRHTGARTFGLRMHRRRGCVRVEVRDPSRSLPCLMPVRPMDVSGRGLFLVNELSDRWGVDLQARGKTTWFELRVADRFDRG
ncbi:ATP-binding protein [Actinacidiphila yeochonensis]|uniref:ATP-binding protein n=1 Tax=Actinacidiphila yeochonensis TaxID=89050 RepID=UPI00055DECC2|nr:ATP-binding protein [Actinacidiphila yeochonensis]